MKGLSVLGAPAVISVGRDPSLRPPRLAQVLDWAERGEIVPHVSHTFPLRSCENVVLGVRIAEAKSVERRA
jgi:NADPH2:quinone reductase